MTLTAEQKKIITATAPLVGQNATAISARMYELLFQQKPKAEAYFNMAHQADGAQPRSLGNALVAYALNIEKFEKIEDLGETGQLIVQKHVGLQIKPSHYTWVGKPLLQAIVDVLGADVVTQEISDAWGAAYWQLAKVLISAEKEIYDETKAAPGGWEGARQFKVTNKQNEGGDIVSFEIKPVDGKAILDYKPGQFLTFHLDVHGKEIRRNYSLSEVPNGTSYKFNVLYNPKGVSSKYFNDDVKVGDVLEVYPPAGSFFLEKGDSPVVLLAGGIGVTPLAAFAEQLAKTDRKVEFVYWTGASEGHLVESLKDLAKNANIDVKIIASPDVSLDSIKQSFDSAQVYAVGPKPFLIETHRKALALGVPETHFHAEFFAPTETLN